jgi:hypothetical protein
MDSVKAIFWIYQTSFSRTIERLAGNWTIIFAPLAYGAILAVAAVIFSFLGFVGRMIVTAVAAACASSGLYLIENIVRGGKVVLNDFVKGFSVYLWEILGIAFILWLPMTLLSRIAYSMPQGPLVILIVQVLLYVVLNAVPELIYQSRVSGLALLSASYEFIVENWLEWLLPNLLIVAAGYLVKDWLMTLVVYLPFYLWSFLIPFAFGLFLIFLMIFRGFLFSELSGTTRRSRVYRYRARA